VLFLVFAGWGIFSAPLDWVFQYLRRPKAVITKSEYIDRARGLAQRAKEIKVCMFVIDIAEGRTGHEVHANWRSTSIAVLEHTG